MSRRSKRALVLAASFALIVVSFSVFAVRAAHWQERGWAGFGYFPANMPEQTLPNWAPPFMRPGPGSVMQLWPGGPAEAAGIRPLDRVETINGIDIGDSNAIARLARDASTGSRLRYQLRRGEQPVTAELTLRSPLAPPRIKVRVLLTVLIATAFLLIGLLVFWNQPDSRAAGVFVAVCGIAAINFYFSSIFEFDQPAMRGVRSVDASVGALTSTTFIAAITTAVLATLLSSGLLHLSLVFPRQRPLLARYRRLPIWIHSATLLPWLSFGLVFLSDGLWEAGWLGRGAHALDALVLLVLVTVLVRHVRSSGLRHLLDRPILLIGLALCALFAVLPAAQAIPGTAGRIASLLLVLGLLAPWLVVLIFYPLLTILFLFLSYRESGLEERAQVRWPLWGTVVGIAVPAAVGVSVSLLLLGSGELAGPLSYLTEVSKLAYLLIPVSFAFAILKHRLLDVEIVIKRTLVYGIATGIIVALYFGLVSLLGILLVRGAGLQNQAVTVIATLLVAGAFLPLRNRLQRVVDRRFFRGESDRADALRSLRESSLRANDLDALLAEALELLQRTTKCRSIAVLCRSGDSEALVPRAKIGAPDSLIGVPGLGLDHVLLEPGREPQVWDLAEGSLPEELTSRFGQPVIAAQCRLRSETVGLLLFGPRLGNQAYDELDREFIASVADQLSFAIDSLRDQPRDRDFEQAYQMQRALLPRSLEQVPGVEVRALWLPARSVSGDYYDVFNLNGRAGSPTRIAFCIADVSGKGMPAALLMSSLQGVVKLTAPVVQSPREVCSQARSVICQNLTGGRFISFFYGTLDLGQRLLTYTNCGHNPPLVVHADGTLSALDKGGPVLARLMRETPLEEDTLSISSGDRVVLFTDGVTEAQSVDGEEYGEHRLTELLRSQRHLGAAELRYAIADSVRSFTGGRLQDDVTLVVLAVEDLDS